MLVCVKWARFRVKQGGTAREDIRSCPGNRDESVFCRSVPERLSEAGSGISRKRIRKSGFAPTRETNMKGAVIMQEKNIPTKIYLEENEIPRYWYNVRADMKEKPAPLLNPGTHQPMTVEELSGVFCEELAKQELDDDTRLVEIPEEIRELYKMYRPSPLMRAYRLEKYLKTPAKIYYNISKTYYPDEKNKAKYDDLYGKYIKLNSALAQAYYAKKQGLKGVTTETGAGQWGTALAMACSFFNLDCKVFMVKVSYEQKPFRREEMRN